MDKREPDRTWTITLWLSRIGEVFVAIADSILTGFRR